MQPVIDHIVANGWIYGPLITVLLFPLIGMVVEKTQNKWDDSIWGALRKIIVTILPFNEDGTIGKPLNTGEKTTPDSKAKK